MTAGEGDDNGVRLVWPSGRLGVRIARWAVCLKGLATCCVGLAEFFSARVVERSPWGTIREDGPRFLGLGLLLWGVADLVWQLWLSGRARRAWRYLCVSAAGLATLSLRLPRVGMARHPNLLLGAGAIGAVCLAVLLILSDEFPIEVD